MISRLECDQDISMGRGASLHEYSGSACITVRGGRNMNACTRAYFECLQQHWTGQSLNVQMQRQDLLTMQVQRAKQPPPTPGMRLLGRM